MSCTIISPKSKTISKLGEQLRDIYKIKDVEFLKQKYSYFISDKFKNRFGDWINESGEEFVDRINKQGEPQIYEDDFGNYYVLDKDYNKLPINNRRFSGLEQLGIKELTNFKNEVTSQMAAFIFDKHINREDFSDIEEINFNLEKEIDNFFDYALSKVPKKSKNKAEQTYNFLKEYNKDWKLELLDFFKAKSLEYTDSEDILDETKQKDQEDGLGVDLRPSVEKNSKDNATAKIKLLLSFLPEINSSGKVVYGKYVVAPKLLSFNQVWYDLEKELKDIPKVVNGNKVSDPLEIMKERLKVLSIRKPYIKALLFKLNKLDVNTQTQFVNAFADNTIFDFDTIEVSGREKGRRYKRINAAETTNKSNKILNDWGIDFQKEFVVNQQKDQFNSDKLKKVIDSDLKVFKDDFNKLRRLIIRNSQVSESQQINLDSAIESNILLLQKTLSSFGIQTSPEALNYYLSNMGELTFPTNESYLSNMRNFLNGFDFLLNTIVKKPSLVVKRGNYINPFLEESQTKQTVISDLAKANAFFNQEISENTLIAANKVLWKYNLSSHTNDKINIWKQDNSELLRILEESNSEFAKTLVNNPDKLEAFKLKMTSTIQEEGKAAEGTDNTSTSEVDALNRDIFEVLGHTVYGGNPTYQTPTPADKATAFKLSIDYFIESGAREVDEEFKINNKVLDIFVNYFEDEYKRATKAKNDILEVTDENGNIDTENLIQYFHANRNGYVLEVRDREGNLLKGGEFNNSNQAREFKDNYEQSGKKAFIVFGGNAFKNMLAPSLSFDRIVKEHPNIPRGTFYKSTGEPVTDINKLTTTQRDILKNEFKLMIQNVIKSTINDSIDADILTKDGQNNNIDARIWNNYKGNLLSLFGDYVVNSMIAQVEYTKLFSGDMAMHKNIVDYFKRIPGTYISGKGLRLGIEENDHRFKITVLNDVIIDSKYRNQMPGVADYYKGINQADAQAYITPKRWKFLKERLGQWSNKHDVIYNKMLNNKPLEPKEIKLLSTQPIKGVYRSLINGRPVYLKYSQLVLLPGLTEGSPLDNLKKQMESQNIDEAVMNSGIKIGANVVENVTDSILQNQPFNLTEIELDNRFWKLQQDLPTKLFKDTLLGSQLQKNIFNNISFEKQYDDLQGDELYKQLHNVVSALSDMGRAEIFSQLSIGTDFVIKDWSNFTKSIVDQLKQQKVDSNIVKAVEKEMSPYVLPQARTKILNTIFSMINKKTVKIKTNGASLIQMSNFGLDSKTATEEGVYWLKEPDTLAEPRLIKDVDGRKKVLSGQVFVPATFISKYIPDWRKYKPEQLFGENGLVDKRALNILGYRIPNQGTSSNDALEIVGILPEGYGDTIVTYTGITTKTGSDFDIDKMFIIAPHLKPVFKADPIKFLQKKGLTAKRAKSILDKLGYYRYDQTKNIKNNPIEELYNYVLANEGSVTDPELKDYMESLDKWIQSQPDVKLKYIEYNEDAGVYGNDKKALQNRVLELYNKVLLSEHNYESLMTPLDYPFIEDDIKELFNLNNKNINNLEMISPFYQIKLKYQFLAGRFGIGQVANQLVDHMRGQTANMELPYYLGWGNFRKTKDGKVTIFDKNSNGQTLSESVDGLEAIPIDNSISAILNAFVDIAKDPYITIGNWNTITTNLGVMLLRAGVHPFKVNAFLGQPVIKKLTRETYSREGKLRLRDKGSKTLFDELRAEYMSLLEEDMKKEYMLENNINDMSDLHQMQFTNSFNEFTKRLFSKDYYKLEIDGNIVPNRIQYRSVGELRRSIKDKDFQSTKRFYVEQLLALKGYEDLNKLAKKFRLGVSSSKFGESGAGVNPIQLMISKNNIGSIFNDNIIRGFENKFIDSNIGLTSLGTYYNNTIGLLSDIIESNPKLFLINSEYFRELFNQIASETHINKDFLNDESLGNLLDESLYSAILSGYDNFSSPSDKENKKKFFNELFNDLYLEIESLKKSSNNFLVQELELKKDGKFKFVGINNIRNKPVEYNNKITNAWLDLAEKNKSLSDKLVLYAYYQSGFRNNVNSIYKFIPHEFFIENDLDSYINYISKEKNNLLQIDSIKEQIYRHNWNNSKLVPVISRDDIAGSKRNKKSSEYHMVIRNDSDKYTSINEEGQKIYPPFVSRYYTRNTFDLVTQELLSQEQEQLLYKLDGYQLIDVEENIWEPVYVKTYKLGYKSNKGQFHEYSIDSEISESIYSENNLTKKDIEGINKLRTFIESKRKYIRDGNPEMFIRDYVDMPNITTFERKIEKNLDNSEKNVILQDMKKIHFKLPIDKTGKDQGKADLANSFIGYKVSNRNSSTGQYLDEANRLGIPTNENIIPNKNTVAFVSVTSEGINNEKTIEQAKRVLNAGGTIIMDASGTEFGKSHSNFNKKGEGAVQDALGNPSGQTSKGYNYWGSNPEIIKTNNWEDEDNNDNCVPF